MSEKELIIKISDCSDKLLIKTAEKCGFLVVGGGRHFKVKTISGVFVTTIPRHSRLKRELVRGVVIRMNQYSYRKIIMR